MPATAQSNDDYFFEIQNILGWTLLRVDWSYTAKLWVNPSVIPPQGTIDFGFLVNATATASGFAGWAGYGGTVIGVPSNPGLGDVRHGPHLTTLRIEPQHCGIFVPPIEVDLDDNQEKGKIEKVKLKYKKGGVEVETEYLPANTGDRQATDAQIQNNNKELEVRLTPRKLGYLTWRGIMIDSGAKIETTGKIAHSGQPSPTRLSVTSQAQFVTYSIGPTIGAEFKVRSSSPIRLAVDFSCVDSPAEGPGLMPMPPEGHGMVPGGHTPGGGTPSGTGGETKPAGEMGASSHSDHGETAKPEQAAHNCIITPHLLWWAVEGGPEDGRVDLEFKSEAFTVFERAEAADEHEASEGLDEHGAGASQNDEIMPEIEPLKDACMSEFEYKVTIDYTVYDSGPIQRGHDSVSFTLSPIKCQTPKSLWEEFDIHWREGHTEKTGRVKFLIEVKSHCG